MGRKINDEEFQGVLKLPAPKRYEYFVKKVADGEELWSLSNDSGWALTSDDDGTELVPMWPHERFAEACIIGVWSAYRPKSIQLDRWLAAWIPGIIKDSRKIAVFKTPDGKGIVVEPERLKNDIEQELTNYED